MKRKNKMGGFTLIEILIVIGIIAILAGIVLIAVNPSRQFKQANDAQRSSNVNAILNAIGQYSVDHKGDISALNIPTDPAQDINISKAGVDLCDKITPTYIPALPADPISGIGGSSITDCSSAYNTKYTVIQDVNGRITVAAPDTEATTTDISVTR